MAFQNTVSETISGTERISMRNVENCVIRNFKTCILHYAQLGGRDGAICESNTKIRFPRQRGRDDFVVAEGPSTQRLRRVVFPIGQRLGEVKNNKHREDEPRQVLEGDKDILI
jgi:hypothetical protein